MDSECVGFLSWSYKAILHRPVQIIAYSYFFPLPWALEEAKKDHHAREFSISTRSFSVSRKNTLKNIETLYILV